MRASDALLLVAAAALPLGLGACGLILGLEDHEPFPADAGPSDGGRDEEPDAPAESGACTQCGAACVDLQTDALHCGACDTPCLTGHACTDGVCGERVVGLAAGGTHGCALLHEGAVYCWGSDVSGELALKPPGPVNCPTGPCNPTPSRVAGLDHVVEISAGLDFTCARRDDGSVWCWGGNAYGQLGHAGGDVACLGGTCDFTPKQVAGLASALQISAGGNFACARTASGIACWGNDSCGQLGDGVSGVISAAPKPLANQSATPFVDVSAGFFNQACAVTAGGGVLCWGDNYRGALGHDPASDTGICSSGHKFNPVAQQVAAATSPPFTQLVRVHAGNASACADKKGGGTFCWGSNGLGALGLGSSDLLDHPAPAPVGILNTTGPFDLRYSTACALASPTTTVFCWGHNSWGTVGDGLLDGIACEAGALCEPGLRPVALPMGAVQIAAGPELGMAISPEGSVWAWGANPDGRLGHVPGVAGGDVASCANTGLPCSPVPRQVMIPITPP